MKIENKATASGGIGFLGLLTIVLVVLKTMGFISIKWLWVFAPMWIPTAVGILILIVMAVVCGAGALGVKAHDKAQKKKQK